jgi:hypothetical protein
MLTDVLAGVADREVGAFWGALTPTHIECTCPELVRIPRGLKWVATCFPPSVFLLNATMTAP